MAAVLRWCGGAVEAAGVAVEVKAREYSISCLTST